MKGVNLQRVRKQHCWVKTPRTPVSHERTSVVTMAATWQCCAEDKMSRRSRPGKPARHSNGSASAYVRICDG